VSLKQPYLVVQIFVPEGAHVSFEVGVSDSDGTQRRLFFSTSFRRVLCHTGPHTTAFAW
jgi:hypothetical protein